jgi:hypothetical protein
MNQNGYSKIEDIYQLLEENIMKSSMAAFLTLAFGNQNSLFPNTYDNNYNNIMRPALKGEKLSIGNKTFLVKEDCFFIDRRLVTRVLDKDDGECILLYLKEDNEFDFDKSSVSYFLDEIS